MVLTQRDVTNQRKKKYKVGRTHFGDVSMNLKVGEKYEEHMRKKKINQSTAKMCLGGPSNFGAKDSKHISKLAKVYL